MSGVSQIPCREKRNAAFFMPSCYAIGAKNALIYAASRMQNEQDKGKIPFPLKLPFYCVTNPQQRSDEAMAVFRVEKNGGYTVMNNHLLRNKELSLKTKGLLSQMLSLPEDWDYTLAGLSHINRESIDAIRTAVWELKKAGYITRRQGGDAKGKMVAIEYTIYEQPQPPSLENPMLENPTTDNPTTENPMQLNKDIQRTDLPKKDKSNTDLSITHSIPILSFPLTLLLWKTTRQSRRKGSERKRKCRLHLRFTRKSSKRMSAMIFSNRICPTIMTG